MSANETNRNVCSSCGKPTIPDAPFCPDCGAQMNGGQQTTRTGGAAQIEANDVERVTTTSGVAQTYAATEQKVPDSKGRPRAGKWVLVGAVLFVGLVGVAWMFIENAGWKVPTAQTASPENDLTPSASIAPSLPSFPRNDKYVAAVRGGILAAPYNTTTVGKAFEATFIDSKWESKETAKGARFVEFTGRLKPEVYKQEFAKAYKECVEAPRQRAAAASMCALA